MKKIQALMKFDLASLFDNRTAFVYSVIFPLLFFSFSNWNKISSGVTYNNEQLMVLLSPYLSYVLLSNSLNSVILITYGRRESGFLKMYYFIVGHRFYLLLAPAVLYYFVTVVECLGFTLIAMVVFHNLSTGLVVNILLIITILYFPTCGVLSPLLLLPVKPASMTAISGGVLILAVLTYNYSSEVLFLKIFSMINPTILLTQLIRSMLSRSFLGWELVLLIGVVDCLIGVISMNKLPVISKSTRV